MELSEFVANTLLQICQGVATAHQKLQPDHGEINPPVNSTSLRGSGLFDGPNAQDDTAICPVHFDIALTVAQENRGGGGAKIQVVAIKVGAEAAVSSSTSSVHRVQFAVPVQFPSKKRR